jgi:bifunctional UDP-N-acetylglucosamine pyrophosphorylase/glucosamine-1-phosphate N-acetyltransferase
MPERTAIVLAAGEGTRMASGKAKVLHRIGGRSLLGHVLDGLRAAGVGHVGVVIGPDRDDVAAEARRALPQAEVFVQRERRGTAHAVLAARAALEGGNDTLVVFSDTPLLRPGTMRGLLDALNGAAVAILGFRPTDPGGYGRLIVKDGNLVAIREDKDATAAEKKIPLCCWSGSRTTMRNGNSISRTSSRSRARKSSTSSCARRPRRRKSWA